MEKENEKLLWAIANNNLQDVKDCIQAGADVNHIGYFDETPLIYACRTNAVDPDIISALLQAGAFPNHREYNGFTPLLLAVTQRSTIVVDRLLRAGADPYITLQDKNVVWYALQSPNPHMLAFLSDRGMDIDMVDPASGYTSLDWAYYHNIPHYIERLSDLGAEPTRVTHYL